MSVCLCVCVLSQVDGDAIAEGKVLLSSIVSEEQLREVVECPYTTGASPWSKQHHHVVRACVL